MLAENQRVLKVLGDNTSGVCMEADKVYADNAEHSDISIAKALAA
ncbi:MAG: hypothetical protein PVG06_17760 [Desulfobacterales bacterium]|jgi:hypothetical protein